LTPTGLVHSQKRSNEPAVGDAMLSARKLLIRWHVLTADIVSVRPSPNTCGVTHETSPIHPVGDKHSPGGAIGRIGLDQNAVDASHWLRHSNTLFLCCVVYTCTIFLHKISAQTFLHSLNYTLYLISQYESLVLYWKKPTDLFRGTVQEHCSLNLVDYLNIMLVCYVVCKHKCYLQIISKHVSYSLNYISYLIFQYESLMLYWKKPTKLFMCSVK